MDSKILQDRNLSRSMKFYAQRKDWHNAFHNLKMKNLLGPDDTIHTVEKFLREHFPKDIITGTSEEFVQILKAGTNNFHLGDLRELAKFIQDIIQTKNPEIKAELV